MSGSYRRRVPPSRRVGEQCNHSRGESVSKLSNVDPETGQSLNLLARQVLPSLQLAGIPGPLVGVVENGTGAEV